MLKDQTLLFQTVHFIISYLFALSLNVGYIWPIDKILSGDTTLGQCGPGSDGIEGVLLIPQSCSITRASPSNCLMSYTRIVIVRGISPLRRETKRMEKKLDGNDSRMLRAILNKSWRQHPTKQMLYGHLPPENYSS